MDDGSLALAVHVDDTDVKRLQADYRALLKTFSTETGEAAAKASRTIKDYTQQTVAAKASERSALQQTLAEYRKLAAEAKRGSAEQAAANKLAGDTARKLGVEAAGA